MNGLMFQTAIGPNCVRENALEIGTRSPTLPDENLRRPADNSYVPNLLGHTNLLRRRTCVAEDCENSGSLSGPCTMAKRRVKCVFFLRTGVHFGHHRISRGAISKFRREVPSLFQAPASWSAWKWKLRGAQV